MKHASALLEKQVRVKEPRATHVFEAGRCSCGDQWRWEERNQGHSDHGAEALLNAGAAEALLKEYSAAHAGAAEASAEESVHCRLQNDASAAQFVSRHDPPQECGPTHVGEGGTADALFAEFGDGGTFAEVDSKPDAGPLLWAVLPGHLNIIGAGGKAINDEAMLPQSEVDQYEIDQFEMDQRKHQSRATEVPGVAEVPGATEAPGTMEVPGTAEVQVKREHAEPQSSRSVPQLRAMPQSTGGQPQALQRQAGRVDSVADRVVPSLTAERAGYGGLSAECRFGARCTRPQCNFRHPTADEGQMAIDDGGGRRHDELQDGGEERRRQQQQQQQLQVGQQQGQLQSGKRRQKRDESSSASDSDSSDGSRERRQKRQKQRGKSKQRAADSSDDSEPQRRKKKKLAKSKQQAAESSDDSERQRRRKKKLGKSKQRAADSSSDDSEQQRRRKQKKLRQKQKQKQKKPADSESSDDEPERRRRPQRKANPQRKRRGDAAADTDSSESDGGASGQQKRAKRSGDSHAPSKASSGTRERERSRERDRDRESSRRLALDGASDAPPLRKWHGYARAANDGSDHPIDMRMVGELLLERAEARAARDFVTADRLRDTLLCMGAEVSDQSMQWRLVPPAAGKGGALGVGRANPGADSTEGSTQPARAAPRAADQAAASQEQPPTAAPGGWCYLDAAEQQVGPVSVGTLRDLHRCGVLRDTTLVRSGEQDDWLELRARGLL